MNKSKKVCKFLFGSCLFQKSSDSIDVSSLILFYSDVNETLRWCPTQVGVSHFIPFFYQILNTVHRGLIVLIWDFTRCLKQAIVHIVLFSTANKVCLSHQGKASRVCVSLSFCVFQTLIHVHKI